MTQSTRKNGLTTSLKGLAWISGCVALTLALSIGQGLAQEAENKPTGEGTEKSGWSANDETKGLLKKLNEGDKSKADEQEPSDNADLTMKEIERILKESGEDLIRNDTAQKLIEEARVVIQKAGEEAKVLTGDEARKEIERIFGELREGDLTGKILEESDILRSFRFETPEILQETASLTPSVIWNSGKEPRAWMPGGERAYLGIRAEAISDAQRGETDWRGEGGLLIHEVFEDSPAEHAGLKPGDVLYALNALRIHELKTLASRLADEEPHSNASVTIWRDGDDKEVYLELGNHPDFEKPLSPHMNELREILTQVEEIEKELGEVNVGVRSTMQKLKEAEGEAVAELGEELVHLGERRGALKEEREGLNHHREEIADLAELEAKELDRLMDQLADALEALEKAELREAEERAEAERETGEGSESPFARRIIRFTAIGPRQRIRSIRQQVDAIVEGRRYAKHNDQGEAVWTSDLTSGWTSTWTSESFSTPRIIDPANILELRSEASLKEQRERAEELERKVEELTTESRRLRDEGLIDRASEIERDAAAARDDLSNTRQQIERLERGGITFRAPKILEDKGAVSEQVVEKYEQALKAMEEIFNSGQERIRREVEERADDNQERVTSNREEIERIQEENKELKDALKKLLERVEKLEDGAKKAE